MEQTQLGPHLNPQLGVEIGERLVHQERRRLAHDGPTHGHPLPLTTGEGLRLAIEVLGDLEGLGGVLDPPPDVVLRHLAELETERHVVEHRHVRVEGIVLEHHGDVPVLGWDVVHHPIADLQLALADVLQPGDHPQQGGLAAPRRADEHHELAVAYLQVDIGDCPGATRVDLANRVEGDPSHGLPPVSLAPQRKLPALERVCRHAAAR